MELIEIVDEDGNFTGEVMDKDEAHDKNLLHNEVAILIINDKRQILLQKRSANKRFHPNKWALCAGHVDAYETLVDAAIRETKEEIGLELKEDELIPFLDREYTLEKTNSHITYFYYTKCNMDIEKFKIQEEELSEVKWFDIDQVIQMILSHDDSTVFNENRLELFQKLKEIVWIKTIILIIYFINLRRI